MKKIIAGIVTLVALFGVFFFAIHPIWLKAGSDVVKIKLTPSVVTSCR